MSDQVYFKEKRPHVVGLVGQEHIDRCRELLAYLESRSTMRGTTAKYVEQIESLRKVLESFR